MVVDGAPRLQVLGAINLDVVARVDRAPRPGETVSGGVLTHQAGGKGANQATAAARLGGRVRLIGAVGDDDSGAEMLRSLESAGVAVDGVQRTAEATGTALIVVDGTGENSIVVCPGANTAIDISALSVAPHDPVLAQLEVDLAVVSAVAAATDGFFALNVSPATALPHALVDRVDLFIVNEGEYETLPERARAGAVALTLGAEGALFLRGGRETARAASPAASVVSTVGAGDAFAAALVIGLLQGWDDAAALQAACAVGAAAVGSERSQPPLDRLDSYRAR